MRGAQLRGIRPLDGRSTHADPVITPRWTGATTVGHLRLLIDGSSASPARLRAVAASMRWRRPPSPVPEPVLLDRERIATGLQRRVVQRLFGLGMRVEGLRSRLSDSDVRDGLGLVVDELDGVIHELRRVVLDLEDRTVDGATTDRPVLRVASPRAGEELGP